MAKKKNNTKKLIKTKAIDVEYVPNEKQAIFHNIGTDICVYGGAKGGGKSAALVMDALKYALDHAGALIYLFRESYDDLESNLIREWKTKVPRELYEYSETKHIARLINGSEVIFRYIANDADAKGYDGRSMDYVGVDELTKHSKEAITVLLSCLRSPKGFPPRFRGTCNPGNKGHNWVKMDYVEATSYGKYIIKDPITFQTIAFIPARVYDNYVIMQNDPNYVKRLENLPEKERKAYLNGDWDLFEGQYFNFVRSVHVVDDMRIPKDWDRYVSLDYGLDMLAAYWTAFDHQGKAHVYKEAHIPNLIISEARELINSMTLSNENIINYIAPPDLWNRRQDTGKSAAEIFSEGPNGIFLVQASNDRIQGWYNMREWLRIHKVRDEQTGKDVHLSNMVISSECPALIRSVSEIQADEKNPSDVAKEPHILTHASDSIRYLLANRPAPTISSTSTYNYDDEFLDEEDIERHSSYFDS